MRFLRAVGAPTRVPDTPLPPSLLARPQINSLTAAIATGEESAQALAQGSAEGGGSGDSLVGAAAIAYSKKDANAVAVSNQGFILS